MPDSLIAALQHPACYPHAVSSITLRETHISWVLLTGDYAYKVKKPLKLSFLDFSTLALRKYYCEEELRLNRRFAPELYVAVVAITGTPAAPTVDGSGAIIDYAVKLKQFQGSDELTQLLAASRVTCDDLANFGRALAQTQTQLARVPDASVEEFKKTEAVNLHDLERLLPSEPRIATLYTALTHLESRLDTMLAQRYRSDAIRDCHGDLHIGNVVRLNGLLTPFDCIEFDATLRNIDVLNDMAFLFMDLAAHNRRDLAYCFLNGWLEQSGDYAGLPLLPYYAAHRALVRAKVAAMQAQHDLVALYLNDAQRRLQPHRPLLIITCGLSGSGKSWLSRQLASQLGAVHIRSDIERKRLAGLSALATSRSAPGAGIYTRAFNAQTYARLLEYSRAVLLGGENTIVDAAFLRASERTGFGALAKELDARFVILHCVAATATLQERIRARAQAANDASEATIEVLAKQAEYWEPFKDEETAHVVAIETATIALPALIETLARR